MGAKRWRVDGKGARDFEEGSGGGGGVVEVRFEGRVGVRVEVSEEE